MSIARVDKKTYNTWKVNKLKKNFNKIPGIKKYTKLFKLNKDKTISKCINLQHNQYDTRPCKGK